MSNTFTFTQKAVPLGRSNFGNIPVDGSHQTMTGVLGAGPQTIDISATPLSSPQTVSNSAVTTLTTPLNAAQLNIMTHTNTVNISEADSTVATNYFTLPTDQIVTIEVARCATLYLKANTGSATVTYWYNVV